MRLQPQAWPGAHPPSGPGRRAGAAAHRPAKRRIEAPDLVGLGLVEASRTAHGLGLGLSVSVLETKVGPWGLVLSQLPAPLDRTRPASHIHVTVAGRPHVVLPDVRMLPAAEAAAVLRRAGLVPGEIAEQASRTILPGLVVGSRPRAGTLVPNGSLVDLRVARLAGPRR